MIRMFVFVLAMLALSASAFAQIPVVPQEPEAATAQPPTPQPAPAPQAPPATQGQPAAPAPTPTPQPATPVADADRDGIPNSDDQCANTPQGVPIFRNGCSQEQQQAADKAQEPPPAATDSDGDKVADNVDQCKDTPQGTPVLTTGCPPAAINLAPFVWAGVGLLVLIIAVWFLRRRGPAQPEDRDAEVRRRAQEAHRPAAPTGLAATPGNAQVVLNWAAITGAVFYTVKRATTAGGPYTIVGTANATTYTDAAGLTNGTQYFYVVSAYYGSGEGPNSAEVSAQPAVPAAPAPVVPVIILALLFGGYANAAFAQAAGQITSISPDTIVVDHPVPQMLTLSGSNLCTGNPTAVNITRGVSMTVTSASPTQVVGTVNIDPVNARKVATKVGVTCQDGRTIVSDKYVTVMDNQTNAMGYRLQQRIEAVQKQVTQPQPSADITALRRQVQAQGQQLAALRIQYSGLDGLEARVTTAARAQATEVVTKYGAELRQSMMDRIAAVERVTGEARSAVTALAQHVDGLEAEQKVINMMTADHVVAHEPKKVERRFKFFGGKPNERREFMLRVSQGLHMELDNEREEEDR